MKKAERLAKDMFSDRDLETILAAIKKFEARTSGEIVISFQVSSYNQPYKIAKQIFKRKKLHKTKERNATLIVLFLKEHRFAIYGDKGIHEKVPDNFWESTISGMSDLFRDGDMLGGLLFGIEELGKNLSLYFPVSRDDINELSDNLDYGDH